MGEMTRPSESMLVTDSHAFDSQSIRVWMHTIGTAGGYKACVAAVDEGKLTPDE